jgi:hypothetical protein
VTQTDDEDAPEDDDDFPAAHAMHALDLVAPEVERYRPACETQVGGI